VDMGFPRQEQRIAANLPRLGVSVAVAEGGSFSFISGAVPRAPRGCGGWGWSGCTGLRASPWRLRRRLANPRFVWLVVGERLRAGRIGGG